MLGLLALRAGSVVSATKLIDALWGEEPPRTAKRTLHSHMSRLRRVLDEGGLPDALVTRDAGYVLTLPPAAVDAWRFTDAVRRAQQDSAGDVHARIEILRAGLALWRGDPFEDYEVADWAVGEVTRLRELRASALEDLWGYEVRSGRHTLAVPELERLVAMYPLRERLWGLLMMALDLGGRRADALAAYQRARRTLVDQLGIEPGPALRRRHAAILATAAERDVDVDESGRRDEGSSAGPGTDGRSGHGEVWSSTPEPATLAGALPTPLTRLVGREEVIGAVAALFGERRLVTLTGVGGCGKTRIAIAVAARVGRDLTGGAAFIDLSTVDAAESAATEAVADTVAKAPAVREQPGTDLTQTLVTALRGRQLLLVLDNCEHLLGACVRLVARLMAPCPELRVLATSREPLRVTGEAVWPVAPLPVPDPRQQLTVTQLTEYPGVRLFLERIWDRTGRRTYEGHAGAVAEVCAALDGLPLALELAAARAAVLSVPEIASRLNDRFRLLRNQDRSVNSRHRTLRSVLDWSYELADEPARALLRQLSVYAGGCDLEAVEALWTDTDLPAVDVLGSLVDKSLVVVETRQDRSRYRLLETVREYAAARLAETPGEELAAHNQHAAYFVRLAERACARLRGPSGQKWLARLTAEHDNLRTAMTWLVGQPDSHGDLRLALALAWYCYQRGHYREGREWLEGALHRRPDAPAELRIRALADATSLAFLQADYQVATGYASTAIALSQAPHGVASASVSARLRCLLGDIGREQATYRQALAHYLAGRELYRAAGDAWGYARTQLAIGCTEWLSGDLDAAQSALVDSRGRFADLDEPESSASVLLHLSVVAHYRGDSNQARQLLADALDRFRGMQFREGVAWALSVLGLIELQDAQFGAASAALAESLQLLRASGDRWRMASVLEASAETALRSGEPHQAAALLDEATAIRVTIGAPVPAIERAALERTRAELRGTRIRRMGTLTELKVPRPDSPADDGEPIFRSG